MNSAMTKVDIKLVTDDRMVQLKNGTKKMRYFVHTNQGEMSTFDPAWKMGEGSTIECEVQVTPEGYKRLGEFPFQERVAASIPAQGNGQSIAETQQAKERFELLSRKVDRILVILESHFKP